MSSGHIVGLRSAAQVTRASPSSHCNLQATSPPGKGRVATAEKPEVFASQNPCRLLVFPKAPGSGKPPAAPQPSVPDPPRTHGSPRRSRVLSTPARGSSLLCAQAPLPVCPRLAIAVSSARRRASPPPARLRAKRQAWLCPHHPGTARSERAAPGPQRGPTTRGGRGTWAPSGPLERAGTVPRRELEDSQLKGNEVQA